MRINGYMLGGLLYIPFGIFLFHTPYIIILIVQLLIQPIFYIVDRRKYFT